MCRLSFYTLSAHRMREKKKKREEEFKTLNELYIFAKANAKKQKEKMRKKE